MRLVAWNLFFIFCLNYGNGHAQGLFDFGSEALSQFSRGKAEQDAGNLKEAILWYKKAIETDSRHFHSYHKSHHNIPLLSLILSYYYSASP